MEKYGIIYLIRNKVNGKCYVGQTIEKRGFKDRYKYSGEGIERVYKYHKHCKTHKPKSFNSHLFRAINKYGLENFEVIEEFDVAYSKEELDKLEKKYIKEFNCIHPNGYNTKTGGANGNPMQGKTEEEVEEWKEKLRQANLGEKNPMYGKHWTEEQTKYFSELFSGEGNPMYGKTREDMKGDLNPMRNPEIAQKLTGENSKVAKKIICLTTNKVFISITEAGKYYNIKSPSHITNACKGKRKSCGKLPDGTPLRWMYYEEYLKQQNKDNTEVA